MMSLGIVMPFRLAYAGADILFQLTEILVEQEVKPRDARHITRWNGDYYVSDLGVSVSGWAGKSSKAPIPFDHPHEGTASSGTPYVVTFHRRPDGLDVSVEYESFVLRRRITQTGPASCTEEISTTLKAGHEFFEVHRISNHELMFESSRTYNMARCTLPPLIS